MRNVLLSTLVVSLAAIAGCAQTPNPTPNPMPDPRQSTNEVGFVAAIQECKDKGLGNKDKYKPLVCVTVYPGGASVNPLVTRAARKLPSETRNKIKFVSRGLDRYDIEFENTDCVDLKDVACNEQCDAGLRETAFIGKECKYSVVLTRDENGRSVKIKLDPIVIIDTD